MSVAFEFQPLRYGTVRRRWCADALRALLRRSAAYMLVALVAIGSGNSVGLVAVAALLAWCVQPLIAAAAQPAPLALAIVLAHAAIGVLLVFAARPLLWPRRWGDAERALPLAHGVQRRSDMTIVAIALLPLFVAYAVGMAVWLATARPASTIVIAVTLLLVSMALSWAGGVGIVARMRLPQTGARRGADTDRRASAHASVPNAMKKVRPSRALVWLALTRGPADRAGRLIVGATVVLCAWAFAAAQWPHYTGWWLAGYTLTSLVAGARVAQLVRMDLAPLHAAAMPLPLAQHTLRLVRCIVIALPAAVGLIALACAASLHASQWRPMAIAAYAAMYAVAHLGLVHFGTRDRLATATHAAAAWLLMLAILVAIGSEVAR